MVFFNNLRLACLAMLMLGLHLDLTSAGVTVLKLRAKHLTGDMAPNPPDPFVKVWCGSTFAGTTEIHKDTFSTSWSEQFSFSTGKIGDTLKLEMWDKDLNFDDRLFTCTTKVVSTRDVTCSTSKGTLYYTYTVY